MGRACNPLSRINKTNMGKIGPTDETIGEFEAMKLKHKIAYLVFHVTKKDAENKKKNATQAIKVEKAVLKADAGDDYLEAFIEDVKSSGTCRYGVVDWNNKLLFVAWVPDVGKAKDKMVYASIREAFIESLVGIQIKIQASDDGELSKERIVKETASKV